MSRSNHRRSLSLIAATLWILLISALTVSAQALTFAAPVKPPFIPFTAPTAASTLSSSHFPSGDSPNIHRPANAAASPTVLQPFAPPSVGDGVFLPSLSTYSASFFATGGGVDAFGYTGNPSCSGFVTTGPNFRVIYDHDVSNANFSVSKTTGSAEGVMILDGTHLVTCDKGLSDATLYPNHDYNIWIVEPTHFVQEEDSLTLTITLY